MVLTAGVKGTGRGQLTLLLHPWSPIFISATFLQFTLGRWEVFKGTSGKVRHFQG